MRAGLVGLVAVVAACGAPALPPPTPAPTPPPAPTPVAGFEVTRAAAVLDLHADADHLYWADEAGVWRRAHGPDRPVERVLASDDVRGFEVARDDVFVLRAGGGVDVVAKAGGAAAPVGAPDAYPLASAVDGDGIVLLEGDTLVRLARGQAPRRVARPDGHHVGMTAHGGAVYLAGYGAHTLARMDLATGAVTALSDDPVFEAAYHLRVSGDWLLAATGRRVLAVPLAGGAPQVAFAGDVTALAADADGYAALGAVVVAHRLGEPPRLVAGPTHARDLRTGVERAVAVAGPYAYYVADDGEAHVVVAAPRDPPVELWRARPGGAVTALAADGDRVYAAVELGEDASRVVEIGARGSRTVADTDGWLGGLAVDGERIVAVAEGMLYRVDRARRALDAVTAGPYQRATLHGRLAYWSDDRSLWAVDPEGGTPFVVASFERYTGEQGTAVVHDLVFAERRVYAALGWSGRAVVLAIDERGAAAIAWEGPAPPTGAPLAPTIARVGDALYVTTGPQIWRIPLDGDPDRATPLGGLGGVEWRQLFAVRERLVAVGTSHETGLDVLVAVPTDGGAPRPLLDTLLDGGALPLVATGDAVFVYSHDLGAVLRIAVD